LAGKKSTAYKQKFNEQNYDRIYLMIKKGRKEKIQNRAKQKGFSSINSYIIDLIDVDLNDKREPAE
jgi:hypothetical protein